MDTNATKASGWSSTVNAALPRMAWVAHVATTANGAGINIQHGAWVEAEDGFCFEGAWSGDYQNKRPDRSVAVFGSGVVRTGEGLRFITPHHTAEHLIALERDDGIHVANSLPLLLAATNERLDPLYRNNLSDCFAPVGGLRNVQPKVPLRSGRHAVRIIHQDLLIENTLRQTLLEKRAAAPFKSFAEYRDFLSQSAAQIVANANDHHRSHRFTPLSTISKGYDSPACSVLAAENGCQVALNSPEGRDDYGDDSGRAIAESIGLAVEEFDIAAWRDVATTTPYPVDAEFMSLGGGWDIVMLPLESRLPGTLFFTGFHGDKMWSLNPDHASADLYRGDPSGNTLWEFRLRTGFIHFIVPFLGGVRQPDLQSIGRSSEMKPWSIGGKYDRPLPRRIAEDAGIDRSSFGHRKVAISTKHRPFAKDPSAWMRDDARLDFNRYCKQTRGAMPLHKRLIRRALQDWLRLTDLFRHAVWLYIPQSRRCIHSPVVNPYAYSRNRFLTRDCELTVHWAVDRLRENYVDALR